MVNCGAAMYIAPVDAVNAGDPRAAYDDAIAFAEGHQQSYGLEAAGVLAAAVAQAFVPGTSVADIVRVAHNLAHDGTRAAIAAIAEAAETLVRDGAGHDVVHGPDEAGRPTYAYQPSRLSIEELPLALGFCITAGGDFRRAVVDGINSGRDTDSIGVMASAILGALHGPSVIDSDDAELLDSANRQDLGARAASFAGAAEAIMAADAARMSAVASARETIFAGERRAAE